VFQVTTVLPGVALLYLIYNMAKTLDHQVGRLAHMECVYTRVQDRM
jgi:hypothetical protein